MKSLFVLALFALMSMALASGHGGISVGIPLPFIKLRFVDIAQLFGNKHHGGGHGGYGGGHGGFGFEFGGHHGGW